MMDGRFVWVYCRDLRFLTASGILYDNYNYYFCRAINKGVGVIVIGWAILN